MPLSEITAFTKSRGEEIKELEDKKKLLEDIQDLEKEKLEIEEKTRCSINNAYTTIFHLNLFVNTKNKLESYGILMENIDRFTRCVQGIEKYSNYDPFKVIEKFSNLEVLESETRKSEEVKIELDIAIKKLQETKSNYEERLN
jgi:hypothetical protein